MTPNEIELRTLIFKAKLSAFGIQLSGMMAANERAKYRNEYPDYDEGNFESVRDEVVALTNEMQKFLDSQYISEIEDMKRISG